jgi:hypothetical protein
VTVNTSPARLAASKRRDSSNSSDWRTDAKKA